MPDGGARRIRAEMLTVFPVGPWADRPGAKTAAAIWADIVQDAPGAEAAKGAFKRTNHGVGGIRRERHVAVLTGWPQFQHDGALACMI